MHILKKNKNFDREKSPNLHILKKIKTFDSEKSPNLHILKKIKKIKNFRLYVGLTGIHRSQSRWRNSNAFGNGIDGTFANCTLDLRHLKIPFCKPTLALAAFYRCLNPPLFVKHSVLCNLIIGICGSCLGEKKSR